MAICAASLLGGCVVRVAAPAPRDYAEAPPPPAETAQDVDAEVQVAEAPPPLPEYEQPPCPEDGYLWTPGYWRWAGGGYYWVPGTWVAPPRVGVLWTPGYWGFVGGAYVWHAGYWGPHVGFYGGVNYGFGYGGAGFAGGRWAGNSFAYNTTVMNVNTTVIHNTYRETVVNNVTINKVSYNGGTGGIAATPTAQERIAAREQHVPATAVQRQHIQEAIKNPALAAKANGGRPAIAATPRPAAFNAPGAISAHGAAPVAASRMQPNGMGRPQGGADHPQAAMAHPQGHASPQGVAPRAPGGVVYSPAAMSRTRPASNTGPAAAGGNNGAANARGPKPATVKAQPRKRDQAAGEKSER